MQQHHPLKILAFWAYVAYRRITAPKSEALQCAEYFEKILSFMDRKGGHLVDLSVRPYFNERTKDSGYVVCFDYKVPRSNGKRIEQHDDYRVATTSWKDFEPDLHILGAKFQDYAQRSLGKKKGDALDDDVVNLMDEFNQYLAIVKENAKKCDAPHHTP